MMIFQFVTIFCIFHRNYFRDFRTTKQRAILLSSVQRANKITFSQLLSNDKLENEIREQVDFLNLNCKQHSHCIDLTQICNINFHRRKCKGYERIMLYIIKKKKNTLLLLGSLA